MTKSTWQYVKDGCPACNGTGTITRSCPTFSRPEKHPRNCTCSGGHFYDRCTAPNCHGGTLRG